jgi:hypothetical protein
LAGEIGLIEGCRALSSMRWELWDDVRDRFIPFVAIDSETDDLPIGAVRDLWEPNALALKDLEINRCEQLYRTQVGEACTALIESLGPSLAQPKSKELP